MHFSVLNQYCGVFSGSRVQPVKRCNPATSSLHYIIFDQSMQMFQLYTKQTKKAAKGMVQ